MDERLIQAIGEDVLIVTRGARLARQLRWQFARRQREADRQTWHSPSVVTWDGWIRSLADEVLWSADEQGDEPRTVLSDAQEIAIWEQIIATSAESVLINVPATALEARDAWSLVQRWRLPDPARSSSATAESLAFSRWMRAYHARCSAASWLDAARLTDALAPALRSGVLSAPPALLLYGFNDLDPQQRSLLRSLDRSGTTISSVRIAAAAGRPRRLEAADTDTELATVARWAGHHLGGEADVRIGVVVTDLDARRRAIERIFDGMLAPAALMPGGSGIERPYNVAGGVPLASCPAVRGALDILALCRRRVSIDALGAVLRGPWCAQGTAQGSVRALFDLWLRGQGFADIATARLATLAPKYRDSTHGGRLAESVMGGFRLLESSGFPDRRPAPAGEWARAFRAVLDAFGWPGNASAGPRGTAINEAFRDALTEFARLDVLGLKLPVGGAIDRLTQLLNRTRFRYRPADAPVQIMTPDQAAGLEFDHLWVAGMDDDSWPAAVRPNPFIPIDWQRRHGLPGASAEQNLAAARSLTEGLLGAAPETVVSWVAVAGDRELAPSPLIAQCALAQESQLPLADDPREALQSPQAARFESLVDDAAPAMDGVESVRSAGARVFELQALCPFRAFAVERLGAEAFEEPRPGLDARARGQLMHMTLEHAWNRVGSHEALVKSLGSEHLENLVWQAADTALELFARRRASVLSSRLRELERARLVRLVLIWLEIESERVPFEVVAAETARDVELGGVDLRLRIDRIDRIEGVGEAIVDYKSGRCSVRDWFGTRPEAPQLPLYVMTQDKPPVALLFARVRAGDSGFHGIALEDGLVPGVAAYDNSKLAEETGVAWSGLTAHWRGVLERLGQQFRAGDARVDPKHRPTTCRYCHLSAMCRIAESDDPGD